MFWRVFPYFYPYFSGFYPYREDAIIHFDANDEAGSAMLDTIRSEHAIVVGEASVPMDALVGAFAVSYSNSLDEEHVAKIVDAFNALAAHYEITPDFIG